MNEPATPKEVPQAAPGPTPNQVVIEQPSERESTLTVRTHQGPLPDPETLRAYNEILPGSAKRIVASMESTIQHFQECQKMQLEAEIKDLQAEREISKRG